MQTLVLAAFLAAKQVALLDVQVLNPGLTLVAAKNSGGAGEDAARAASWAQGRGEIFLETDGGKRRLTARSGEALDIPEKLGVVLERMNRYFGMAPATTAAPIAFEELKSALLSPEGAARVRELFEEEIRQRVRVGGKDLVPEIGGEATLDSQVRFHVIEDPVRPLYHKIAANAQDAKALTRLYEQHPEQMKLIDEYGLLTRLLAMLPGWEARGTPAKEKRDELLAMTVLTVLEGSSDSYIFEPSAQFDAITSQDWGGRYVGPWHMHPPDMRKDGFYAHVENWPSGNDMTIAGERGQNLTLVFQPDGFDVYDLSPLAGAKETKFSDIKSFTYRSAEWKREFNALHARLLTSP